LFSTNAAQSTDDEWCILDVVESDKLPVGFYSFINLHHIEDQGWYPDMESRVAAAVPPGRLMAVWHEESPEVAQKWLSDHWHEVNHLRNWVGDRAEKLDA
jgi:hypothetical protein